MKHIASTTRTGRPARPLGFALTADTPGFRCGGAWHAWRRPWHAWRRHCADLRPPLPVIVLGSIAASSVVLRWLVSAVLVIRAKSDLPAVARALGSTSRTLPTGRRADRQGDDTVSG